MISQNTAEEIQYFQLAYSVSAALLFQFYSFFKFTKINVKMKSYLLRAFLGQNCDVTTSNKKEI